MRKIKPTTKYQTVSFPEPFYNEIKDFVIKHEKYRSIAEFVKESVRDKMIIDQFSKKPPITDMILKQAEDPHTFVTKEYLDKSLEELSKKMLKELGFTKNEKKETNRGNGHGLS